jgi:hypothetical protein
VILIIAALIMCLDIYRAFQKRIRTASPAKEEKKIQTPPAKSMN